MWFGVCLSRRDIVDIHIRGNSVPEEEIECPFMDCDAGIGVAGDGCCFLGGDQRDPECKKYQKEDEEK